MAFPTKLCVIGTIGCITSAVVGLSQAKSSLSVREKLAFEGYVLISSKDTIANEVWTNRATLYKDNEKNSEILLNDLDKEKVSDSGEEIRKKCESFTNGKVFFDKIGEELYQKIINLCTLKIGEYHKSHFSTGDKFITEEKDWKEAFENNKSEIKKIISEAKAENAKDTLSKYCSEKYKLQQSNKNKDESYNVSNLCIKRNKLISDLEAEENKQWEIFHDPL